MTTTMMMTMMMTAKRRRPGLPARRLSASFDAAADAGAAPTPLTPAAHLYAEDDNRRAAAAAGGGGRVLAEAFGAGVGGCRDCRPLRRRRRARRRRRRRRAAGLDVAAATAGGGRRAGGGGGGGGRPGAGHAYQASAILSVELERSYFVYSAASGALRYYEPSSAPVSKARTEGAVPSVAAELRGTLQPLTAVLPLDNEPLGVLGGGGGGADGDEKVQVKARAPTTAARAEWLALGAEIATPPPVAKDAQAVLRAAAAVLHAWETDDREALLGAARRRRRSSTSPSPVSGSSASPPCGRRGARKASRDALPGYYDGGPRR